MLLYRVALWSKVSSFGLSTRQPRSKVIQQKKNCGRDVTRCYQKPIQLAFNTRARACPTLGGVMRHWVSGMTPDPWPVPMMWFNKGQQHNQTLVEFARRFRFTWQCFARVIRLCLLDTDGSRACTQIRRKLCDLSSLIACFTAVFLHSSLKQRRQNSIAACQRIQNSDVIAIVKQIDKLKHIYIQPLFCCCLILIHKHQQIVLLMFDCLNHSTAVT